MTQAVDGYLPEMSIHHSGDFQVEMKAYCPSYRHPMRLRLKGPTVVVGLCESCQALRKIDEALKAVPAEGELPLSDEQRAVLEKMEYRLKNGSTIEILRAEATADQADSKLEEYAQDLRELQESGPVEKPVIPGKTLPSREERQAMRDAQKAQEREAAIEQYPPIRGKLEIKDNLKWAIMQVPCHSAPVRFKNDKSLWAPGGSSTQTVTCKRCSQKWEMTVRYSRMLGSTLLLETTARKVV